MDDTFAVLVMLPVPLLRVPVFPSPLRLLQTAGDLVGCTRSSLETEAVITLLFSVRFNHGRTPGNQEAILTSLPSEIIGQ